MAKGDHDTAGIDLRNIINGNARGRRSTSNVETRVLRKTPARTQRPDQTRALAPAKESLQKARKVGTGRVAKTKAGTKGKTGGKKKAGASSSSATGMKRKLSPSKPAANKRGRVTGRSFGQPQDRDAVNETADEVENVEQNGDVTMGGAVTAPRKIAKAKKVFRSGKSNRVTRSQGPANPMVATASAPPATAPPAPPAVSVAPAIAAPMQTAAAAFAQSQQDEENDQDQDGEHGEHGVQDSANPAHEMQGGESEQAAGATFGNAEPTAPSDENSQEEQTTDSGDRAIAAGPEKDLAEETNSQTTITGQQTSAQVHDAGGEVGAALTHALQTGNVDTETSAEQIVGPSNTSQVRPEETTQTSETAVSNEQTSADEGGVAGATPASAAPAASNMMVAATGRTSAAGLAETQTGKDTVAEKARDDEAGVAEAASRVEATAVAEVEQKTGDGIEKSSAQEVEVRNEEPENLMTIGGEQEVSEDNDTAVQGSGEVDQSPSLPDLAHSNIEGGMQTPGPATEANARPLFPADKNSTVGEVAQTTHVSADVEDNPTIPDLSASGIENASEALAATTGASNRAAFSASPTALANKESLDQHGSAEHAVNASDGITSAVPTAAVNGAVKKANPRQEFFSDLNAFHSKTKQQIDDASNVRGIVDGNALDVDMFELKHMVETTSFNHSYNTGHWTQIAEQLCDDEGAKVAEGAGEKLRDFYRQWIHPLTFARQEAAYVTALEDEHQITDPIGLDLSGDGMKLEPPRPYLFAQIIADFGGYDMIVLSTSMGDHECSFETMRQLNLVDTNTNDRIDLEVAETILLPIYKSRLRELEKQFPEFGPVSNAEEWSRLAGEREAQELEGFKQHNPGKYNLLWRLAAYHRTTVNALRNYSIGGVKMSLYELYIAYRKQVKAYGPFGHTSADHIWLQLAQVLNLSHLPDAPLDCVYATYEAMIRPCIRDADLPDSHIEEFDTLLRLWSDTTSLRQVFGGAVAGLVPSGPLSLGKSAVDPFRLYSAVEDRGGYSAISADAAEWNDIAFYLGCEDEEDSERQPAGAALQAAYLTLFPSNGAALSGHDESDNNDDSDHDVADSPDKTMEDELDALEDEVNEENQANGDEEEDDEDESDGDDSDDLNGFEDESMSGTAVTATGNTFASHFGHLAAGGSAAPVMNAAQATSLTAGLGQDDDDLPDATDDEGDDAEVSHLSDFYGAAGNRLDAPKSHHHPARSPPIDDYGSDDLESDDDRSQPEKLGSEANGDNVDKSHQAVQSFLKATSQVITKGSEVRRKAPQTSFNIDSHGNSDHNNGFRGDSDDDSDSDDGDRGHAAFTSRQFASAVGNRGSIKGLGSIGSAAGLGSKRKRDAPSEVNADQGVQDAGTPSNGVKRMKTPSPVGRSSPFASLLEGTPAPSRVNANIAPESKSRAKPANSGPFMEDCSSDSEIDPGNAPRARSPKSQQLSERQNGSRSQASVRQSPDRMAPAVEEGGLADSRASEIAPTAVDGTEHPVPAEEA